MQTQYARRGSCHESRGPAFFYGYCHDSRQMRMMDYPEYMSSLQNSVANLYSQPTTMVQQVTDMLLGRTGSSHHHHEKEGCGCHSEHRHGHDHGCNCDCECDIHCADLVEYARCGEIRRIPLTFDNDTRRERPVKLTLGDFATECGTAINWKAALSETEFTLPPCGHKTILLSVAVVCTTDRTPTDPTTGVNNPTGANTSAPVETQKPADTVGAMLTQSADLVVGSVKSCKVGYATLRAEGCRVCPLVIAVAVLPDHCGAHVAGCQCGCCC